MTIFLLITFTTFLLKDYHFLALARIIKYGSLHHSTVNVRRTYLYTPVIVNQENFVKLNSFVFCSRQTVDKNFLAYFNFKLAATHFYNSVHLSKKLLRFWPKAAGTVRHLIWLFGLYTFERAKISLKIQITKFLLKTDKMKNMIIRKKAP